MDLKKLALKKRVEEVKRQLKAAAHNAPIGAVELSNMVFDELADVFDLLEAIAFAETAPATRKSNKSKSDKPRKKPSQKSAKPKSRTKKAK